MEPITVAQLSLLLIVGFLLFRTQTRSSRRGWRAFRRDPSIFPVFTGDRAQRRQSQSEWQRERSRRLPDWLVGAVILLLGALAWWLNH
jgi:hypothetical protein